MGQVEQTTTVVGEFRTVHTSHPCTRRTNNAAAVSTNPLTASECHSDMCTCANATYFGPHFTRGAPTPVVVRLILYQLHEPPPRELTKVCSTYSHHRWTHVNFIASKQYTRHTCRRSSLSKLHNIHVTATVHIQEGPITTAAPQPVPTPSSTGNNRNH